MITQRWILFLLFAVPAFCLADTVTVVDEVSLKPIPNVTISMNGTAITTDARGKASVADFAEGVTLRFSHPSYQTVELTRADLGEDGHRVLMRVKIFTETVTVTSASKREQERREVPTRITQITAEEAELQNPQTAADLLGATGEVYIQKSQLGGGSPMIRGFATNRVLLVIDGVRMNTAIFREGNLQNVISLDTSAIERTEVIFGPGSTIYGSDAVGGVMSFNTLEPVLTTGELFTGGSGFFRSASANDELTGHVDLSVSDKRWGLVISATKSDFDNLRIGGDGLPKFDRNEFVERRNGEDVVVSNPDPDVMVPSGYDQTNVMQKLRFVPSDEWTIDYAFHFSESSDVPRYDRMIQRRDGALRYAEWYYGPQKWQMHSLSARYGGSTAWFDSARMLVAYQAFEESRNDRKFGNAWRRERTETVDAWSFNLDLDKYFDENKRLYYGAEVVHNEVGSRGLQTNIDTGATEAVSTRYPDGSTWTSLAAYASYTWNLRPDTTVVAGARYNHVSIDADFDLTFYPFPFESINIDTGSPTASLGLVYRPNDTLQINLNASTGFRAPNIDDVGKVFESSPGNVVVPNGDLDSELVWSFDAGFIAYLSEHAQLEVAAFYSLLQDAMVRRDFTFNGEEFILYDGELSRVQAVVNAEEATVAGIQTAFRAELLSGLSLRSHFTWIEGSTDSDEPLRHVPPPFGSIHLTWQRERLRAEFAVLFNGEIPYEDLAPSEQDKPDIYPVDANGNPYVASWYTLNLKGQYQVHEQLQIDVGLENILDKRYVPYSSGIPAPGRNLIVALRTSF